MYACSLIPKPLTIMLSNPPSQLKQFLVWSGRTGGQTVSATKIVVCAYADSILVFDPLCGPLAQPMLHPDQLRYKIAD